MKCKKCKRIIEDNSIYCNWCGHKQLTAADDVRVPKPRRKGNTWFAQIVVDDERVYISAPTEDEYYAKARAAKTKQIAIKKAPPKIALGKAIDNYVSAQSNVLSPSTIKSYKSYRENRFLAYMDSDIRQINYQKMVNEESAEVSAKTVANAWRLVTASLAYASEDVPKVNLPKIPKAERPWLDYQQISILLDKIKGEDCETAALLALNGLRRSELLHITSDDVDLERGLIYVRGASVYNDEGQFVEKKTNKNTSSTRTVHIVIPRLTELLRGKKGKIITTKPNTTYVQVNRICKNIGLPEVGVHGLRHSFASLAYHLHWSEATTMREGGWANTDTVHKVYTHLAAADANEDISRMVNYYKNSVY